MMSDKKEQEVIDPIDEMIETLNNLPQAEKDAIAKKAMEGVDKYQRRHDEAKSYGSSVARNFNKKFAAIPFKQDGKTYKDKGLETDKASAALAEILYKCYLKGNEADRCGDLLMEWTMNKFWGKVVENHIPKLSEVYDWLRGSKRDKNNVYIYGDIDASIWYEEVKQLNSWKDNRKVIIHKSNCSCADDRTHIFILDEGETVLGDRLRVRTVWDRQYVSTRHRKHPWGDDRDIDVPSLQTYRDRNFDFGYGDCRDKGYVLSLQTFGGSNIECSSPNEHKIKHAIYLINQMFYISENPDENEYI